ncbi:hypothetical protein [Zavarzinia sp.]|uniref:hypothetical protein n=1 Tax=Zavarzinia sp. TaxID=2027920 RepID=UPI0035672ACE
MTTSIRLIAALGALAIASIGSTGAYAARAQEGDAFRLPPITQQGQQAVTASSGVTSATVAADDTVYPQGHNR